MHTPSIPYHPKGNGRTEAAVKVAQLIHVKESELLFYRDKGIHLYSTAQRIFLRRTATVLPKLLALAKLRVVKEDILMKRHSRKTYFDT